MTKVLLREQAIQLRKEGFLYGQIARELDISKSTSYQWTKNVPLSKTEERRIMSSLSDAKRRAVASMTAARAKKSELTIREIESEALSTVNKAELNVNHRRILCAALFWCEGQKNVQEGVKFINSDPIMMRSFLQLLRSSFEIEELKFRALLHLHEYHDESKQIEFWSKVTKIPVEQFHRSYIKPHTGKNIHEGYPGCLSLRYPDTRLAKLLKMIYSNLGNNLGA